jgi:hypothetical protein
MQLVSIPTKTRSISCNNVILAEMGSRIRFVVRAQGLFQIIGSIYIPGLVVAPRLRFQRASQHTASSQDLRPQIVVPRVDTLSSRRFSLEKWRRMKVSDAWIKKVRVQESNIKRVQLVEVSLAHSQGVLWSRRSSRYWNNSSEEVLPDGKKT